MVEKHVLERLKWTLQEILATADYKAKQGDFLVSDYWYEFEKQIQKWFAAFAKCKEGEFELAAEILEELDSTF